MTQDRPMSRMLAAMVLMGWFGLVTSTAHAATHRFAVVVGNNVGAPTSRPLKFAESDARKFARVLTDVGGFDRRHVKTVLGGTADTVNQTIARVHRAMERTAREQGGKTLFVFYYSGHADGRQLELGTTTLDFDEIKKAVSDSTADLRLAFVDSCHSGRLVGFKGGRRGPAFKIDVGDDFASSGYAVITSSAGSELSQESASVRGAFFTHYLVSALRGAGDRSGDGRVSLAEAYRYAYSRTVARTSATIGGGQHPMYHLRLKGRGDVILTVPRQGSRLQVADVGDARIVVLDSRGDEMVAEVSTASGKKSGVAVRPGRYQVYLLGAGPTRRATATVGRGVTTLAAGDFEIVELAQAEARGGLFRETQELVLEGAFVTRRWALADDRASFGGAVMLGWRPLPSLQPSLRVTWSTTPDVGESRDYHDLGLLLGLGYSPRVGPVRFHLEGVVGYEHLLQSSIDGRARHSSGGVYLGIAGLEVPFSDLFFRVDVAVGGRFFRQTDSGLSHRLDLQGHLGLGYRWSL